MISKAQCSLFSILDYYFLILNSFWGCIGNLSEGKLEILAGEKQFTLTNLRYYNWEQEAAEKTFDANTSPKRIKN